MRTKFNREILVVILLIGFVLLKVASLGPRISDENWYFYAAWLVSEGALPYRDFFIAHLPGQILLYAAFFRVFGWNLSILKSVQFVLAAATAFLVKRMLTQKGERGGGLVAAALFLFSTVVLWTSDAVSGVYESTFFLTLSWYLLQRSPRWSGIALFLGLAQRLYILPAALGILVVELVGQRWRTVVPFILWSMVPFGLLNLLLYTLFGEAFLTPVWRYHFLVKFSAGESQDATATFVRDNWILLSLALAGAWLTVKDLKRRATGERRESAGDYTRQVGLDAIAAVVLQSVFLRSLRFLFHLYYVTVMPFLSVLGALSLTKFAGGRSQRTTMVVLVLVLAAANIILYRRELAGNALFPEGAWIAQDIEAVTVENETIFGAYEITPFLSLESGRRVTDNQVDTNNQRYLAGLLSQDETTLIATRSAVFVQLADIDEESGALVGIRPKYVHWEVIDEACDLFKRYDLAAGGENDVVLLWRCGTDETQGAR